MAPESVYDTITVWIDGCMGWDAAENWASNLSYGSFDDWRLPSLNPIHTSCGSRFDPGGGFPRYYCGYGCTGGEMSHLFVADLGQRGIQSVLVQTDDTAEQIANLALFRNVQISGYLSDLKFEPDTTHAWHFDTHGAVQQSSIKGYALYAVAVRPGDVAASVPEPQTLALLGLGAAVVARRRRTV